MKFANLNHPFIKGSGLLCALFFLLFLPFLGNNLMQAQTFYQLYGDPGVEEGGTCILPDVNSSNGNMYLAGYRRDSTFIFYLDEDGIILWQRSFKFADQQLADRITDLEFDSDQNLIGCGFGTNGVGREGFAFRYNPSTNTIIWNRKFSQSNEGHNIHEPVPGGNFLITGSERTAGGLGVDGYLVELNRNSGAILPPINYQYDLGSAESFLSSIIYQNNLYLCGRFNNAGGGTAQMRISLTRLDLAGNISWTRNYLYPTNVTARQYNFDLIIDADSIITVHHGDQNGTAGINNSCGFSKYTLNGSLVRAFEYSFPTLTNTRLWEVIPTGNGYVLYGGDNQAGNSQFLLGTNKFGTLQWAYTYGPPGSRSSYSFGENQCVNYNGSVYFTGQTTGYGSGDNNIVLTRVNYDGTFDDPTCPIHSLPFTQVRYIQPADYPVNLVRSASVNKIDPLPTAPDTLNLPDSLVCASSTCWAEGHPDYAQLTNSIVINTDEVWTGKYYIGPGVIVTVDGATLDLTNVDLVFDECAGIDFINDAKVRANNSVFRPCNESETWRGFLFSTGSRGTIHACTFKNAQTALDFLFVQPNSSFARITNNLFVNNRRAIRAQGIDFEDPITGNTFMIDERSINYEPADCNSIPYNQDHWGILGHGVNFKGLVSQNDFVNSGGANAGKSFIGISGVRIQGTFSLNHFTNMYQAIEVSSSQFVSVENNEIEVTEGFDGLENQIRISTNSQWIWITGNHLVNVNEYSSFGTSRAAIYVDTTTVINIKENTIEGFINGIQMEGVQNAHIGENQIRNTAFYGIYAKNCLEMDIACNQIEGRLRTNSGSSGIGYLETVQGAGNVRIRSNCIKNVTWGILLFSSNSSAIPAIENNFLYNYRTVGVYNIGFSGDIGSAIPNFTTSGRNTFVSNNIPNGAFDIFSTVPGMTAAGNYGISTVNANVGVVGNGLYNSTASCGLQIGTVSSQISEDEQCDNFIDAMDGIFQMLQNPNNHSQWLEGLSAAQKVTLGEAFLLKLIHESEGSVAENLYSELLQSESLSTPEKMALSYSYKLAIGDEVAAMESLLGLEQYSWFYGDYYSLCKIQLDLSLSGRVLAELSQTERQQIAALRSGPSSAHDLARDLGNYIFPWEGFQYHPIQEIPEVPTSQPIRVDQSTLKVFPNPSSGEVFVEYSLQGGTGHELEIFDLTGKSVFHESLEYESAQVRVDLTEFEPGLYVITIKNQNGVFLSRKVVKQ